MTKFQSYDCYLNEGIMFPDFPVEQFFRGGNEYIKCRDFIKPTDEQIEQFRNKTKLKKGDPIIITGNRSVYVLPLDGSNYFAKGKVINDKKFIFEEWPSEKFLDFLFLKKDVDQLKFRGFRDYGNRDNEVREIFMKLPFAICSNADGKVLMTLNFYSPNYNKKGETFDIDEVKALAKFAAKEMEISSYDVVYVKDKLFVYFGTWFVKIESHVYRESVRIGPFGTKDEAEKKMGEIGKVRGNLKSDELEKFKLRVNSRMPPADVSVVEERSHIPVKEFIAAIDKNYNRQELIKKFRGSTHGSKFGI